MRNLFFVSIFQLFICANLWAFESSSEFLYRAMDVSEENVTPGQLVGSATFEKSVGGLVCQKTTAVTAEMKSEYSCYLAIERRDDRAIYSRLKVDQEYVGTTETGEFVIWRKTFGKFSCLKNSSRVEGGKDSYSCSLK